MLMLCVKNLLVPKCRFSNVSNCNLLIGNYGYVKRFRNSPIQFFNRNIISMPKSLKSRKKGHANQKLKAFETSQSNTSVIKANTSNLHTSNKKCVKPLDASTKSKAASKDLLHSTNTTNIPVRKKKTKKKKTSAQDTSTLEITKSISKLNINNDSKSQTRNVTNKRYFSHSAGSSRSTGLKVDSLEDVARLILSNRAKNIVVMAGAGISTASGIPDFRTPGTGLYDNLQRYNIPQPTAVFDLDYFHERPKPFFELAKELYPSGKYRPNLTHYFLRCLHEKGLLLRLYTQNIDGLERLAGIPSSKLVEAHGTFATASCTKCGKKYNGKDIKHKILKGVIPRCELTPLCWGIVKPDIVFFGEDLPKRFYYYVKDFPQCDLLIVMGTSLEVEPFASLVDSVRFNVPRLLLNRNRVGPFKSRGRVTDVAVTGDIVESIDRFATILGWKNFLNETMESHEIAAKTEAENDDSLNTANRTDSGISSASSGSSDRKDSTKPLHPVNTSNIKRYFHTIRSTPLPKRTSHANVDDDSEDPSDVISGISYYDYIRNSSKRQSKEKISSSSGPPLTELQLLDMRTLAKSQLPTIRYTQTVEKRKDKKQKNRRLSNHSMPALNKRKSGILDLSDDSDSDSSESASSSDS